MCINGKAVGHSICTTSWKLVSPIKDKFGRRDESDHLGGCSCDGQRKGSNFLKLRNVNKSEKEGPTEEVFRR